VRNTSGIVIGKRRLTTRGARPKPVIVSLGQPRLPKGERDWECPFLISGGGLRVHVCGNGVDALQALQNALGGIRSVLDQSGQSFEWLGLPIDVAFPKSIPSLRHAGAAPDRIAGAIPDPQRLGA
jgi:hypothetical protein